jgi:hypothetical protein
MTIRKTFRIGIWESVGGYVFIEAATQDEAEAIAQTTLDDAGVGGFSDFDGTHRECNIIDCEEAQPHEDI